MKFSRFAIIFLLPFTLSVYAGDTPAPDGASVYIISPAHGEVVNLPFKVVFGLSAMGVTPAGYMGPLAVRLVRHHAAATNDLEKLVESLAREIPDARGSEKFRNHWLRS
jgi:hypothetical protein